MCYLLTMGLLAGSLTVPVFAASDADSASDGGGKHYPGAGGQDQMRTAEKAGSVTQYPGAGRLLWLRHRP